MTTDEDDSYKIPSYRLVARNRCRLMLLTWERNWPAVVDRCETHPQEACCVSPDWGRTALHLAMFNQGCPWFVGEALLKANPHAILVLDRGGYTPLHYACLFRRGTTDLIPMLCTAAIRAQRASGDSCHRTSGIHYDKGGSLAQSPLLLACERYAPTETLGVIVSAVDHQTNLGDWIAPVTGGEPYWRRDVNFDFESSPLAALWRDLENVPEIDSDMSRRMKEVAHEVANNTISTPDDLPPTSANEDVVDLWQKSVLLLVESHNHINHSSHENGGSDNILLLLHTVAALGVPIPNLLQLAAALFPEQASQRDGRGLLPLHHVIRLVPEFNTRTIRSMMSTLLRICPATARMPDDKGDLPLMMALISGMGWDDGVENLVMSAPEVLQVRDKTTHLHPYLLAASCDASVTTIFRLLTCCPELVNI